MNNFKRCTMCKGVRYSMSMGGLQKKCTLCKGSGFIEDITESDENKFLTDTESKHETSLHLAEETETRSSKRGRPKLTPIPQDRLPKLPALTNSDDAG